MVSIHAPWEGCDLQVKVSALPILVFQFTHPGKGATEFSLYACFSPRFQFTHPGKGATMQIVYHIQPQKCFNSRTLGRVRPVSTCTQGRATQFQFTHPGKGATALWEVLSERRTGFQFTHPGKGATSFFGMPPPKSYPFQFTHPGKGATLSVSSSGCRCRSFNSRTLGRVRPAGAPSLPTLGGFQFTHPGKGATSYTPSGRRGSHCFNSRTLGRVRQERVELSIPCILVSIHAPWEGCDTLGQHLLCELERVSIHAPWEGCDRHVK